MTREMFWQLTDNFASVFDEKWAAAGWDIYKDVPTLSVINLVEPDFNGTAYWQVLDVLYTGFQGWYAYDFLGKLFDSIFWFKDNDYLMLAEIFSHMLQTAVGFDLFLSVTFDTYIQDHLVSVDLSENSLRKYLAALDPTLAFIYHPELNYAYKTQTTSLWMLFGIDWHFFINDNLQSYSLVLSLNFLIQLLISIYLFFIFISLFFSFFNNSNKEEGAIDAEFAIVNLSIEAEKELFSAEDAKYLILIFLGLFGAYFGFFGFAATSTAEITGIFVGLLPVLVFSIFMIPCNLLFDFGLLFLLYLRGSSNTNSFFFELVYDYIGIIAFFTRLVVQFVRMVLMFVVYCMMHDTVVLQKIAHWFVPANDNLYEEIVNIKFTTNSISYFLLVSLPCRLAYWAYEVIHTFFVVTAQFAAFFTIAFWLFLLFYTFYIYEKFEYHFKHLRFVRREMENELNLLHKYKK